MYTLIPRPIGSFAGMDMTTRYAFGLIYDRWKLSKKPENRARFTDRFGTFCVFSREAMAAEMGVSLPTLRSAMKVLISRELIHARVTTSGGPWQYYIPQRTVDELEDPETAAVDAAAKEQGG